MKKIPRAKNSRKIEIFSTFIGFGNETVIMRKICFGESNSVRRPSLIFSSYIFLLLITGGGGGGGIKGGKSDALLSGEELRQVAGDMETARRERKNHQRKETISYFPQTGK